jgi:hypothetical protein
MATATGNYVCDNSTLANFKSWAQAISNAFSTFGWTQTTDTGQVNWGTIASVPASTYVYEVWKAADALAATMPIYVKMEYGFSTSSPRLRVTVGTSSDGAGNITGQVISSAPWQLNALSVNQGAATTFPCFFSGSSGEFRMVMWNHPASSPGTGIIFVIERSKDATGANTNEYVTALYGTQGNSGLAAQQTFTASGIGNKDQGSIGLGLSTQSNTGLAFGTVAAFPFFPILGKVGNPMLGVMSVVGNDGAANSIVTVTSMYGGTHTYVCGGPSGGYISFGGRSVGGALVSPLVRYE